MAVRLYPTMFRLWFGGGLRFRMCCSSPISSCYSNAIHLKKKKEKKKKNRAQCNFCSKTFLLFPLYESHFIKLALYWYLYIYIYMLVRQMDYAFASLHIQYVLLFVHLLHTFRFDIIRQIKCCFACGVPLQCGFIQGKKISTISHHHVHPYSTTVM